ncbi:MAG: FYDLN acid domain-containing protein [Holosporales bacterium]
MKASWGQKRFCKKCGAHFYDLQKDPFTCPKCETTMSLADYLSKSRTLGSVAKRERKKADKAARENEMPILDDELAHESDVLVDDDILEADTLEEEDVADVLERPNAEEE